MPDDQHAAARQALGAAEDAGERLDHRRARVVDLVGQVDRAVRLHALGEPAGPDRRRRERLARRLVPGQAARALAARKVVEERDATAVDLGDDLVAEHLARVLRRQLLDVRAAEAAGENGEGVLRLGHVDELRPPLLVEYDRAHRGIVGPWRSSSTVAPTSG